MSKDLFPLVSPAELDEVQTAATKANLEDVFPRDERCGKLRYPTERSAQKGVKTIRRSRHDGYGNLRPYLCPTCKHWHVGHAVEDLRERRQRRRTA